MLSRVNKEAKDKGIKAANKGEEPWQNPYKAGTAQASYWTIGYWERRTVIQNRSMNLERIAEKVNKGEKSW